VTEYIPPEVVEGGGNGGNGNGDGFICDYPGCDRTFSTVQGVMMHKMRVHTGQIPGDPGTIVPGVTAKPRIPTMSMLDRQPCQLCGKLITESRLNSHLRRVHNATIKSGRRGGGGGGGVECDICHNVYASHDSLNKHKRTMHRGVTATALPAVSKQISDDDWREKTATVARASAEFVRLTAERADYQLDLSRFIVDDDVVILRTPDGQRWMLRKID
jgi:hypothetical protein